MLGAMASQGGSFDSTVRLIGAPWGGWTQASYPHAVHYNGKTYFGWVNGYSGNVEVAAYTHATRLTSTPFVLHAALETDTHDAPAIIVRDSDKRLMCFYMKHDSEAVIYMRVSTNPEDATAWAAEVAINAIGGTRFTYPSVVQLTGEANDPIYVFYRDEIDTATTAVLCYTKSTDDGATWANQVAVYKKTSAQSYWVVWSDGGTRIDLAVSDGNAASGATVNSYHTYYSGGNFYTSDGTLISATKPFGTADLTQVYASTTAGPGWPTSIGRDGSGNIAVAIPVTTHATGGVADQFSVRYIWWNGSAWTAGTVRAVDYTGIPHAPMPALDPASLGTVYLSAPVNGVSEMFRYVTSDNGSTWTGGQLTSHSRGAGHIYPAGVTNHAAALKVIWLAGTYATYLDYRLGVMGSSA